MNSFPTPNGFNSIEDRENQPDSGDPGLQRFALRLKNSMGRDILVQTELDKLRTQLQCDRVILYYLYYQWKGQVTFESSSQQSSQSMVLRVQMIVLIRNMLNCINREEFERSPILKPQLFIPVIKTFYAVFMCGLI